MNPRAVLLLDLSNFIRRFVSLSRGQADVCALWVLHTWAFEAAHFTPYLNITSPLPRCGKSTLQQLLSLLVNKPWYTSRVTAAVLVRRIHKEHPTLLLDESDAAFQGNKEYAEALRGILNSGFERNGACSMCVPPDWEPKNFSTFCPKAIAGIGRLPDTVEDRSIPIRLQRKLPSEPCERLRLRKVGPDAEVLRQRAATWATQYQDNLDTRESEMPNELNDRQQDVCEPLVAIADLTGDDWPSRVRQALIELLTGQSVRDDADLVRLLADIRDWFEKRQIDRTTSTELVGYLKDIEESPWGDPEKGYPLTPIRLARLLKPIGVRPRDLRFPEGTFKGYERADFEDAWARYLTPVLK